jgi:hypothetical protein
MAKSRKKIRMSVVNNKLANNKAFRREVFKIAEKKVSASKAKLLQDFDEHPVTREIRGGHGASNISNTLGGYGNLFTFIGFVLGSDPIGPVRRLLQQIRATELKKKSVGKKRIKYDLKLSVPSRETLTAITPLPFESGRSWLYGVESGISGFGAYMYKKWRSSRSGHGIQSNQKLRSGSFKNTKYFSSMLQQFARRIR